MITFQDLQGVGEGDKERMEFVYSAIDKHQNSDEYKVAQVADEYFRHQNRTIVQYQKLLYTISGQAVPDNWSANYKLASNFFKRFVTQQVQYLLGNGATWGKEQTAEKLGDDFDNRLQEAAKVALIQKVAFGFWNMDHLEVFDLLHFVPLYDEENGALSAGIRFWQIDTTKPLRATLYELDGVTQYMWTLGKGEIMQNKAPYKLTAYRAEVDENAIYDGENYPTFPIVPLWGNAEHQSEIIGLQEQIDAYDLIKSGFANDLDDVSQIYWTISNAGGMDDIDLAQFVQKMKTIKAAAAQDGQEVEAHAVTIPVDGRETLLDRLRKDMYRDFMALDTEEISGGAVTATQIRAQYEPMNSKADDFEYCVNDFLQGILAVAGIDDQATFTRSIIVNQAEEITNLVSAGEYLSPDYITTRILTVLGDADKVEEVLTQITEQETINLTEEPANEESEQPGGGVNGDEG